MDAARPQPAQPAFHRRPLTRHLPPPHPGARRPRAPPTPTAPDRPPPPPVSANKTASKSARTSAAAGPALRGLKFGAVGGGLPGARTRRRRLKVAARRRRRGRRQGPLPHRSTARAASDAFHRGCRLPLRLPAPQLPAATTATAGPPAQGGHAPATGCRRQGRRPRRSARSPDLRRPIPVG